MSNFVQAAAAERAGASAQRQAEANAAIDRANAAVLSDETRARTLDIYRQGQSAAKSVRASAAGRGLAQEGTPLIMQAEAVREAEMTSLEEQRIGLTEERRLLQSAALNVRRGQIARGTSRLQALTPLSKGLEPIAGKIGGGIMSLLKKKLKTAGATDLAEQNASLTQNIS